MFEKSQENTPNMGRGAGSIEHVMCILNDFSVLAQVIIITMYVYHALINTLSAHMIHINLNMIFCTHVEHRPTKTIYTKYYLKKLYKNQ